MKQLLKSTAIISAVLAISFGFQSCATTKPIDKSKLAGHWVLETLEGKNVKESYPGQVATLEFDLEKNTMAGIGGCNNYTGGFTLTELNEFSAPRLAMTMKMCMDMGLENEFSKTMATDKMIISLSDAGILNFDKNNKSLLTFKIGEKPQRGLLPLNATTLTGDWRLTKLEDADLKSLFGERVPTLKINEDGKINGFSGCNRMNTSYKLDGATMTFGPIMGTKMACENLEAESKFTSILTGSLKATRIADKLTLANDKGIIALEFQLYTPEAK